MNAYISQECYSLVYVVFYNQKFNRLSRFKIRDFFAWNQKFFLLRIIFKKDASPFSDGYVYHGFGCNCRWKQMHITIFMKIASHFCQNIKELFSTPSLLNFFAIVLAKVSSKVLPAQLRSGDITIKGPRLEEVIIKDPWF